VQQARKVEDWTPFQSAPRSEERGDVQGLSGGVPAMRVLNPRPAPKSGAMFSLRSVEG